MLKISLFISYGLKFSDAKVIKKSIVCISESVTRSDALTCAYTISPLGVRGSFYLSRPSYFG